MKKIFILTMISAIIALFLIYVSIGSFSIIQNKKFFELQKINRMENQTKGIFLYTLNYNENNKYRLLNLPSNKKCSINKNQLSHNSENVQIWEINCEK